VKAYAATGGQHDRHDDRPPLRPGPGRVDDRVADLQRVVDNALHERSQRRTTLGQAVEGVTVLERAKGVVMMRYDVSRARATEELHRWARLADVDVLAIAQAVVKSVSFDPDLPEPDAHVLRLISGPASSLLG